MIPTPKEISDKFQELPEDMKKAISDETVAYNLQEIGNKYGLRVDKIDTFISEVSLIMLGFKKTNEFIKSLVAELDVDKETAESIAIDVDNKVFKKIRESLQSVQYGETAEHDKAHEDVVPSPARDSLLKEIEDHATDGQNPAPADISSTYSGGDYNPASFASTVEPSAIKARRDTYRESITMDAQADEPQEPLPETPYERVQHEPTPESDPMKLGQVIQKPTDGTPQLKPAIEKTPPVQPEVKAQINNDPYRESID